MSLIPNDPRSILVSNISSKASVPEGLLDCLTSKNGSLSRKKKENDNPLVVLKKTMNNPYVNHSENERIAVAILNGNSIPTSNSGKVLYQPHKNIKEVTTPTVRHSTKLNFLELTSEAAPVHTSKQDELKKSKSKREVQPQGFVWAGQFVESVPEVIRGKDSQLKDAHDRELKAQSIAQAQALSKK